MLLRIILIKIILLYLFLPTTLKGVKIMFITRKFNWPLWGCLSNPSQWTDQPTGPTKDQKTLFKMGQIYKLVNKNVWSVNYGCPRGSPQMGYIELTT